jgi:hypothetical protein
MLVGGYQTPPVKPFETRARRTLQVAEDTLRKQYQIFKTMVTKNITHIPQAIYKSWNVN